LWQPRSFSDEAVIIRRAWLGEKQDAAGEVAGGV